MPNPYAFDLRERAVAAFEAGEGTYAELAEQFVMHPRTLQKWVRRKRLRGSAPGPLASAAPSAHTCRPPPAAAANVLPSIRFSLNRRTCASVTNRPPRGKQSVWHATSTVRWASEIVPRLAADEDRRLQSLTVLLCGLSRSGADRRGDRQDSKTHYDADQPGPVSVRQGARVV
jgi:transposase-like protein